MQLVKSLTERAHDEQRRYLTDLRSEIRLHNVEQR